MNTSTSERCFYKTEPDWGWWFEPLLNSGTSFVSYKYTSPSCLTYITDSNIFRHLENANYCEFVNDNLFRKDQLDQKRSFTLLGLTGPGAAALLLRFYMLSEEMRMPAGSQRRREESKCTDKNYQPACDKFCPCLSGGPLVQSHSIQRCRPFCSPATANQWKLNFYQHALGLLKVSNLI